jgi:hypothetical protein
MMMIILAPKPMEGIEEKLLKHEIKNQAKNTYENLKNEKHWEDLLLRSSLL